MKRYIAGIDPGTTVGLAGVDLHGSLIFYQSVRGSTPSSIERFLLSHGKPIIIATDKAVPPYTVSRLASQLGAILFAPKADIPRSEKDRIARLFRIKSDDHIRDALAAAYAAYSFFRPKIDTVFRRLQEREFVESLVEKVLKGQQLFLTLQEEFRVEEHVKKRKRKRDDKEVVELRKRIGELTEELRKLKKECMQRKVIRIKTDEEEILKLKRLLEDKERFLRSCEHEVSRLRDEIFRLKSLIGRIEQALDEGKIIRKGGSGDPLWKNYVATKESLDIKTLVEKYRKERVRQLQL